MALSQNDSYSSNCLGYYCPAHVLKMSAVVTWIPEPGPFPLTLRPSWAVPPVARGSFSSRIWFPSAKKEVILAHATVLPRPPPGSKSGRRTRPYTQSQNNPKTRINALIPASEIRSHWRKSDKEGNFEKYAGAQSNGGLQ